MKPWTIASNLDDRDLLAQIEAVDAFMGRMHAYPGRTFGQLYHRFFRTNDLAQGRLGLTDRTIDLADVTAPLLAVAGLRRRDRAGRGLPPRRRARAERRLGRARDGSGRPPRRAHRPRRARYDMGVAGQASRPMTATLLRMRRVLALSFALTMLLAPAADRAAARARDPARRDGRRRRRRQPDAVAGGGHDRPRAPAPARHAQRLRAGRRPGLQPADQEDRARLRPGEVRAARLHRRQRHAGAAARRRAAVDELRQEEARRVRRARGPLRPRRPARRDRADHAPAHASSARPRAAASWTRRASRRRSRSR